MPDDHSDVVPLLPIPNRTVKRFSADDSAGSRVKVGHRQAIYSQKRPVDDGAFLLAASALVVLIKTKVFARNLTKASKACHNSRLR